MTPDVFLQFAELFPEPMLLVSGEGVVHAANTAARDLMHLRRGVVAGVPLEHLVTESPAAVRRFVTRCLRSGQMLTGSLTWTSPTGSPMPTRAEGARLQSGTSADAPLVIIRCVPKQAATLRFVALTDQINALGREVRFRKQTEAALLVQAERLARSNADLQQFAYVASHDLQEPLRTIASFSALLGKRYGGQLDAEANQFIEYVVAASTRISDMIRDILTYSQELDPDRFAAAPVDTQSLVALVLNDLQTSIHDTGASVEVGTLPTVHAQRAGLAQVFQNLISNAIKYQGTAAPIISVSAEHTGSEWVFSITDNGIGIAPEERQAVFGLFRRLHRDERPGTGIGLALCKKIVERHGGRIWIESAREAGSVFRFTIPASPRR